MTIEKLKFYTHPSHEFIWSLSLNKEKAKQKGLARVPNFTFVFTNLASVDQLIER